MNLSVKDSDGLVSLVAAWFVGQDSLVSSDCRASFLNILRSFVARFVLLVSDAGEEDWRGSIRWIQRQRSFRMLLCLGKTTGSVVCGGLVQFLTCLAPPSRFLTYRRWLRRLVLAETGHGRCSA